MTKQEVQHRILKDGKPLGLDLFNWDEATKTLSSKENGLVIDFSDVDGATITAGDSCTITARSSCTIKAGWNCTITAGWYCTITAGDSCTITAGSYCTIKAGSYCTIKAGSSCTITAGSSCTITAGWYCTITAGKECAIIRRDIFQVIVPLPNEEVKLCPYEVAGYISKREGESAYYMDVNGERIEHFIADGILSKVVNKHGNVMKVVNHGQQHESYLVTDGINYAHGKTIDEARESLIYKINDRDTSMYNDFTLDTVVSLEDGIKMYRRITGACEEMTKDFVHNLPDKKDQYSIREIIDITKGRYNNEVLVKFFNK